MTRTSTVLTGGILAVMVGVVFHAPISVGLGTLWPEYALLIKAWKEVLIAVLLVVLAVELYQKRRWRTFLAAWPVRLALAFGLWTLVLVPWMFQGPLAAVTGLLINLRYSAFFVLVYGTVQLYPDVRRLVVSASLGAAAISLLFAVLQATVLPHDILKYIGYNKATTIAPYLTVDQNYDFVRISGTLRGPNPLGAYAGMVLSFLAAAWAVVGWKQIARLRSWLPWLMVGVAACAVVALWYSYSRSALVAAMGMVGIAVGVAVARRAPRMLAAITGGLVVVIGVSVLLFWQTPLVQNVVLHDNPTGGGQVSSNDDHLASLETGWQRLVRQPLGAGIGSTGSASLYTDTPIIIENQYLFVAHEAGWVGLGLFIALLGAVLGAAWRRRQDWLALGVLASGLGLAAIGLLLPVWADDTVALLWWGLAAMALGHRIKA